MRLRDRALAAINHEEVFPVPVDVFENGVYPKLEEGLRKHFGLPPSGELPPTDRDDILIRLGACSRRGNPFYVGPPPSREDPKIQAAWPHRKTAINIWGTWDGPESYTDVIERPLARAETASDVDAHKWPNAEWFDFERVGVPYLQPDAGMDLPRWADQNADYLRIAGGWSPIASRVLDLFGMELGLTHMAARPDLIRAAVAHIGEFYEEYYSRLARSVQGRVDVLGFGDDFASQRSMLISPAAWRQYFLPQWEQLFSIAHAHGLKTMMHSCGAIRPVLGNLIDAGLDILEVVQTTAAGMDPSGLKTDFGEHLVFYGGVDVQKLMPYGPPHEVRTEVRRLIDIFAKDGGYILVTSHFMMDDIPVENVLAMYDEGRSYTPARCERT